MKEFVQIFSSVKEHMGATLSRSDVLKSLAWLVGMLLTATVGLAWVKAPDPLMILVSVLLGASVILYLASFAYCLIQDPDNLRSEKYSIPGAAAEALDSANASTLNHAPARTPNV